MAQCVLGFAIIYLSGSLAYSEPSQETASSDRRGTATAFLGIGVRDVTRRPVLDSGEATQSSQCRGLLQIQYILPGSAAARSQLSRCDLITTIDDESLDPADPVRDFIRIIRGHMPGDAIILEGLSMRKEMRYNGTSLDIGPYATIPLDEIYHQKGDWTKATIDKKLMVEPFRYQIILGSRNHDATRRKGLEIPQVESDSKEACGLSEFLRTEYRDFFENVNEVADLIREDTFIDIYGKVYLETLLHLNPGNIVGISERVSEVFRDGGKPALSKAKFLLDGDPSLKALPLPPLPQTKKDALAQLVDVIHTKRVLESEFFQKENTLTLVDAETSLHKLLSAYAFSDEQVSSCLTIETLEPGEISRLEAHVNYEKMFAAGEWLLGFFSKKRMGQFERLLSQSDRQIFRLKEIRIIIGSPGNDRHVADADLILDFSGNDSYLSFREKNRKGMIIDLKGDDLYQSDIPFQFGGAFMKASLLLDFEGNDTYSAKNGSLGAGIGGIGILRDHKGDDLYIAPQMAMGLGLFGIGMLHDSAGADRYVSGYLAQGVGLTGGVGLLMDEMGDDRFTSEGLVPSSYGEPLLYDGFSQGVGFGLRHLARGEWVFSSIAAAATPIEAVTSVRGQATISVRGSYLISRVMIDTIVVGMDWVLRRIRQVVSLWISWETTPIPLQFKQYAARHGICLLPSSAIKRETIPT
ncbi:MAG: PDZ domain-containing protein [Deltaproteobacteria bacterium]|nr:PDZ domain-containing protein [Deltaproteobacteria bacterium]